MEYQERRQANHTFKHLGDSWEISLAYSWSTRDDLPQKKVDSIFSTATVESLGFDPMGRLAI
jgi:hypothetical protein